MCAGVCRVNRLVPASIIFRVGSIARGGLLGISRRFFAKFSEQSALVLPLPPAACSGPDATLADTRQDETPDPAYRYYLQIAHMGLEVSLGLMAVVCRFNKTGCHLPLASTFENVWHVALRCGGGSDQALVGGGS